MSEPEQTYDARRARNLEALLRALARRIQELDQNGRLLAEAAELMKLTGDVRSELFHYEVRITYDTPEVAENRRIVSEAKNEKDAQWEKKEWTPDEEKDRDKEW
jgi:hypothetical protein